MLKKIEDDRKKKTELRNTEQSKPSKKKLTVEKDAVTIMGVR